MNRAALEIISCLLIILFVYAAVSKLMDLQQFRIQLGQSPLLTTFAPVILWLVPAMEILISLMLVTHRFRLIGLYASFTLMVLFTLYITAILQLDRNIPCSCGGILSSMGWTEHLIFNIGFSMLAATGVLIYPQKEASEKITPKFIPAEHHEAQA